MTSRARGPSSSSEAITSVPACAAGVASVDMTYATTPQEVLNSVEAVGGLTRCHVAGERGLSPRAVGKAFTVGGLAPSMDQQSRGDGPAANGAHLSETSESVKTNWERTLQDIEAMAADREENGFTTCTITAGSTAPVPPAEGADDEFGLTFIVSKADGETFESHYDSAEFTETAVYQRTQEGHVYVVVEQLDMDAEVVVFLAGTFRMRDATDLVRAATDREEMHTRVKAIDHTEYGAFTHDDVSAFFPEPAAYYAHDRQP